MFEKDILKVILNKAPEIEIDDESKIVFISDCHRGDGTWKDALLPNRNIYMAALSYYYNNGFTQIEIGDGDELWKVTKIVNIYEVHQDIFEMLLKFKNDNRFYMIFGNHDAVKNTKKFKKDIEKLKFDLDKRTLYNLFHDTPIYEGISLIYKPNNRKVFVVHGHQVDFMNYNLSFITKFLVRYVWSFLEQVFGFKNLTSPAKNNSKRTKVDKKLEQWAKSNNQPIIAGHTHRSRLPEAKKSIYFNDGCCVHPYSMSSIELENGKLTLIKWSVISLESGILSVKRQVIGGPVALKGI